MSWRPSRLSAGHSWKPCEQEQTNGNEVRCTSRAALVNHIYTSVTSATAADVLLDATPAIVFVPLMSVLRCINTSYSPDCSGYPPMLTKSRRLRRHIFTATSSTMPDICHGGHCGTPLDGAGNSASKSKSTAKEFRARSQAAFVKDTYTTATSATYC